jgi:hypothetical protein
MIVRWNGNEGYGLLRLFYICLVIYVDVITMLFDIIKFICTL